MAMAKMYYVQNFDLSIGVMDGIILTIEKGKRPFRILTVVDGLDTTFEAIHVANNRLHLDGLALVELMGWLYHQKPTASGDAFVHRLLKFFPGSSDISDLLLAISRCVAGIEHQAHGESAYFCARVRKAHPAEFDELRIECSNWLITHNLRINQHH